MELKIMKLKIMVITILQLGIKYSPGEEYRINWNDFVGKFEIPKSQRFLLWIVYILFGQKVCFLKILENGKPIQEKQMELFYSNGKYLIFRKCREIRSKKGIIGLQYFIFNNGMLIGKVSYDLELEEVPKVEEAIIELTKKGKVYSAEYVTYKVGKMCAIYNRTWGWGAPITILD